MIKDKISVLIGTCDSYKPIWKNFQICFNRIWSHKTRNIFVTENLSVDNYTNTKFDTINYSSPRWGERMLYAIKQCNTDYIFFILEDYLFYYNYTSDQITEYINIMDYYRINRLQISPSSFQTYEKFDGIDRKYLKISKHSLYAISMQPSLWRKDYLNDILKNEYSPWDFEVKGSLTINNDTNDHKIFIDSTIPSVYFNAIGKGFIKNNGWEKFRNESNLEDF